MINVFSEFYRAIYDTYGVSDLFLRNQLGISKLLASLLHDLIGTSATQIGKSCFFVRLAYRAPDGQMIYEEYVISWYIPFT